MKIAIVGNAGGGKTTLAKALSKHFNIPLHHIDKMQWLPGWKMQTKEQFEKTHDEALGSKDWVIEGVGPSDPMWKRLSAADLVIFVDLPVWRHFWWAIKRQFQTLITPRDDMPENCPMWPMTIKLLKVIWYVHKHLRPEIATKVEALRSDTTKSVYRITSPTELTALAENAKSLRVPKQATTESVTESTVEEDEEKPDERAALLGDRSSYESVLTKRQPTNTSGKSEKNVSLSEATSESGKEDAQSLTPSF